MLRIYQKAGISLFVLTVCALLILSSGIASSQAQIPAPVDPLVGLWSMNFNSSLGPTLITMTFNPGGTTVEYDTTGNNSFASPGESLVQGIWKRTGPNTYTFKEQNFIFNASGILFADNIATCQAILGSDRNSFTANCELQFFSCTVLECPGTQLVPPAPATISATRFE